MGMGTDRAAKFFTFALEFPDGSQRDVDYELPSEVAETLWWMLGGPSRGQTGPAASPKAGRD